MVKFESANQHVSLNSRDYRPTAVAPARLSSKTTAGPQVRAGSLFLVCRGARPVVIQPSSGSVRPLRESVSAKDSGPALQGHPGAASLGLRQKNPRSHSRPTTAEGGWRFLKNAKSVRNPRSPRCKSRRTQERIPDDCNNFAPTPDNSPAQ